MKIVVLAEAAAFETLRRANPDAQWVAVADVNAFLEHTDADAFFDLTEQACTADHPALNKPLFLNSVIYPVSASKKAIRINGWNSFLENDSWEIAGEPDEKDKAVLSYLNKKYILSPDEPGFIAARIIAMIINEAYFAKGEDVSTEAEIDTAMKLGTNYPFGPFEWAEKIGLPKVFTLLKKLSLQDSRYEPAPLLTRLAHN